MNVLSIVKFYLAEKGFDGLYNMDGDCACDVTDLSPMSCMTEECKPGYREKCNPETCELDGDCDFHIVEKKP